MRTGRHVFAARHASGNGRTSGGQFVLIEVSAFFAKRIARVVTDGDRYRRSAVHALCGLAGVDAAEHRVDQVFDEIIVFGGAPMTPETSGELEMKLTPFKKILIANRGEIALRVMRTARRMGYGVVAVYSTADRNARHVLEADEAVHIGENLPSQSYLRIEAIIEAAKLSGVDAVHPGYGFLAENENFASSCRAAGLVFIGPSANSIRSMGDRGRRQGNHAEGRCAVCAGLSRRTGRFCPSG